MGVFRTPPLKMPSVMINPMDAPESDSFSYAYSGTKAQMMPTHTT